MLTSKAIFFWISYHKKNMGYLHIILWKKMFCAKKVTKLPDLTVCNKKVFRRQRFCAVVGLGSTPTPPCNCCQLSSTKGLLRQWKTWIVTYIRERGAARGSIVGVNMCLLRKIRVGIVSTGRMCKRLYAFACTDKMLLRTQHSCRIHSREGGGGWGLDWVKTGSHLWHFPLPRLQWETEGVDQIPPSPLHLFPPSPFSPFPLFPPPPFPQKEFVVPRV